MTNETNQKQIQQQRIKWRIMNEQGKKYAFYQMTKMWSNANKKRKEEEYKEKILKQALRKVQQKIDKAEKKQQKIQQQKKKQIEKIEKREQKIQKQQEQKQQQKQQKKQKQNYIAREKAVAYVKFLFPSTAITTTKRTNTTNKKLPPCVRTVAKRKPAYLKYPNLDAIRKKK